MSGQASLSYQVLTVTNGNDDELVDVLVPAGFNQESSGVTNTGDAAVADVALGKTFSSSALTNATGTSTKNATVPSDAPILPAQAFVDYCVALPVGNTSATVSVASNGITSISTTWLHALNVIFSALVGIDASGNAITNTDAILALMSDDWDNIGSVADQKLINLSGGTSVAPTIDAALPANAGTASMNQVFFLIGVENGRSKYQTGDTIEQIWWTGAEWKIGSQGGGNLYYKSSSNVSQPWLAVWVTDLDGSDNPPTVSAENTKALNLRNNGWTVTTN